MSFKSLNYYSNKIFLFSTGPSQIYALNTTPTGNPIEHFLCFYVFARVIPLHHTLMNRNARTDQKATLHKLPIISVTLNCCRRVCETHQSWQTEAHLDASVTGELAICLWHWPQHPNAVLAVLMIRTDHTPTQKLKKNIMTQNKNSWIILSVLTLHKKREGVSVGLRGCLEDILVLRGCWEVWTLRRLKFRVMVYLCSDFLRCFSSKMPQGE